MQQNTFIKVQVLYIAKHHLFGQCWQGSKLGHSYISGNYARDDIDRVKK